MWQGRGLRHGAFLAPGRSLVSHAGIPERVAGEPESWLPAELVAGSWRIIVSSHYLRFAALPWSRALETAEGRTSYLASRWRQLYGDAGTDWSLCLQAGHFEQGSVLLAWPRNLAQLLEAAGVAGLTVQPLITAAFHACAAGLPSDCLFATLEPGCLALAVVRGGQIQGLSTHRVGADWQAALSRIHQRLCLQDAGMAALGPIHLLALVEGGETTATGEGWRLLPLPAATVADSLLHIINMLRPGSGFNLLPVRRSGSRLERLALGLAAGLFLLSVGLRLSSAYGGQADTSAVVAPVAAAPQLDAKARQKLGREVLAVNHAVASLNLPADAVINALSPQSLKDVALLSIDITDASAGKARVVAGARSLAGMEAYLHQLEQRHDLAQVSLLHHETAASADWPYRFTVEAQWQPL